MEITIATDETLRALHAQRAPLIAQRDDAIARRRAAHPLGAGHAPTHPLQFLRADEDEQAALDALAALDAEIEAMTTAARQRIAAAFDAEDLAPILRRTVDTLEVLRGDVVAQQAARARKAALLGRAPGPIVGPTVPQIDATIAALRRASDPPPKVKAPVPEGYRRVRALEPLMDREGGGQWRQPGDSFLVPTDAVKDLIKRGLAVAV